MSGNIWLPPVLVLALGLIAAWWAVRRFRGQGRAGAPKRSDRRLRFADLEARRDDLYARLARADDDGLDAEARAELERAAASTLRELDRAAAGARKRAAAADKRRGEAQPAPTVGPRAALVGFVSGIVASAVIGMLVFWAVRDAKPDPQRMEAAAQATPASDEPHGETALPPFLAAQVAQLEATLAADPDDLDARKRLALTLLQAEQYLPAFQHASEVLQRSPEDPDARFVHGVVRLAMGQVAESIALLDQVLGSHPEHVYAYVYKGLALARQGDRAAAIETWREGVRQSGGEQPELQRLLDMAERALTDEGAAPSAPQPAPPATAAGGGTELEWQVPDSWTAEPPASPMRRAQYRIPGPGGDAELVVFYFGPGQGGDARANAERWAGQLNQPDGRPSTEAMITGERTVGEMPVMVVEVGGAYSGGMGGGGEVGDALLLGAIAEGPDANWFFKLVGPRATVESQRASFDDLIASLRVAG